jgi:hypothetical protein
MLTPEQLPSRKNPRRVLAGRLNQLKGRGLTNVGREKLRQSALKHQPWFHFTGPKTQQGKLQARRNGKRRQRETLSRHERVLVLDEIRSLLADMGQARHAAIEAARS